MIDVHSSTIGVGGYGEINLPFPAPATGLISQVNALTDGAQAYRLNDMHFGVISLATAPDSFSPGAETDLLVLPWESDRLTPPSSIRTNSIVSHWIDDIGEQRIEVAIVTADNEVTTTSLLHQYRKTSRMLTRTCVDQASLTRIDPFLTGPRERFTPKDYSKELHGSSAVAACRVGRAPFAVYQIGATARSALQPNEDFNIVRELHPNLIDPRFTLEATRRALASRITSKRIYAISPDGSVGLMSTYQQGHWQ